MGISVYHATIRSASNIFLKRGSNLLNQEIVQIFRDLNDGEWVEEAYNAIETIPRSMEHVPEENNNNQHHTEELESDNDHLVIVNSLIIPNEQVTAAMLKRLHQLQTVKFF